MADITEDHRNQQDDDKRGNNSPENRGNKATPTTYPIADEDSGIDGNQNDISLDDISRYCNISTYYFSKLFKQETGENYVEYLNRIRIEHAKQMMNESDKSIKEICFSVGFSDPNYFSRAFKKYEGISPTEYKEGR
mgnify:CR=1 FL=1